jgi:hypothetical protein
VIDEVGASNSSIVSRLPWSDVSKKRRGGALFSSPDSGALSFSSLPIRVSLTQIIHEAEFC